ncbi:MULTISPECIES: hypothetical protein [Bacillus]|uniref:hypothetical protein n=1 Tax=Bacillus TaxID=1386 RepID=UPI0002D9DBF7|nr:MULTISPECIES: hypothetical protein [Bacillus]
MRNNPYLLTYSKDGVSYFKWFATEMEMDQFIDNNEGIEVNEGIHIKDSETIRGFRRKA